MKALHCVRDLSLLQARKGMGAAGYECQHCSGVFIELAALPELAPLAAAAHHSASQWPQAQGACPKCRRSLHLSHYQGVEIDICPHCRALWLDGGELQKIKRRQLVLEFKDQAAGEAINQGMLNGGSALAQGGAGRLLDWVADALGAVF